MNGGGRAAGDDVQLAADGGLHPLSGSHQLVHFLRSCLDRAIAPQVGTHSGQLQVGHLTLHLQGGLHQFILVPEALPQVAQVHHKDHLVAALARGGLHRPLHGPEDLRLAVEADVRPAGCLLHLGQHGDPDQHQWDGDAVHPQVMQLLQTGGGDAGILRFFIDPGCLGKAVEALDHTGQPDPAGVHPAFQRPEIVLQLVQIDLQLGVMPYSKLHSFPF